MKARPVSLGLRTILSIVIPVAAVCVAMSTVAVSVWEVSAATAAEDRVRELQASTERAARLFAERVSSDARLGGRAIGSVALDSIGPAYRDLVGASDAGRELRQWYRDEFAKKYRDASGQVLDWQRYVPSGRSATAQTALIRPASVGGATEWRRTLVQVRSEADDIFRSEGYADVMAVDSTGDVVFTGRNVALLGANLLADPWKNSKVAAGVKDVLAAADGDSVVITGMEPSAASGAEPTFFVVARAPSQRGDDGAFVIQISYHALDAILGGTEKSRFAGLGETAETYLIDRDKYLLTSSRLLLENRPLFRDRAAQRGVPARDIELALRLGTTASLIRSGIDGIEPIFSGRRVAGTGVDFSGAEVEFAAGQIGGVSGWGVVAKIEVAEVRGSGAPLRTSLGTTAASTAGLALIIAVLLRRAVVRPLQRAAAMTDIGTSGHQLRPDAAPEPLRTLFRRTAALVDSADARAAEASAQLRRSIADNFGELPPAIAGALCDAAPRFGPVSVVRHDAGVVVVRIDRGAIDDDAVTIDTMVGEMSLAVRELRAGVVGIDDRFAVFHFGISDSGADPELRAHQLARRIADIIERHVSREGVIWAVAACAGRATLTLTSVAPYSLVLSGPAIARARSTAWSRRGLSIETDAG